MTNEMRERLDGLFEKNREDISLVIDTLIESTSKGEIITIEDMDVIRQWFDALQRLNSDCLGPKDYEVAKKLNRKLKPNHNQGC